MPLLKGKKNNMGKNIKTEMSRGKPYKQAVAIALNTAAKKNKKYRSSSDGKVKI